MLLENKNKKILAALKGEGKKSLPLLSAEKPLSRSNVKKYKKPACAQRASSFAKATEDKPARRNKKHLSNNI